METSGGSNSLKATKGQGQVVRGKKGGSGQVTTGCFLSAENFQNTFCVSDVFFSGPNFGCDMSGIQGCSFEEYTCRR